MGEITGLPECIVDKKTCKTYHNAKSLIVHLIAGKDCNTTVPNAEGLVVDLSVIIRAQAAIIPKGNTFNVFT